MINLRYRLATQGIFYSPHYNSTVHLEGCRATDEKHRVDEVLKMFYRTKALYSDTRAKFSLLLKLVDVGIVGFKGAL